MGERLQKAGWRARWIVRRWVERTVQSCGYSSVGAILSELVKCQPSLGQGRQKYYYDDIII